MARRADRLPAEAKRFVNGTAETVTLPRVPVRLGYSPAMEAASMARRPGKRDMRRAERREGRRALRDEG